MKRSDASRRILQVSSGFALALILGGTPLAQSGQPVDPGPVRVGPHQLAGDSTCSPSWLPTFGEKPGMNGEVHALTVFDDGGGAALYAGGRFSTTASGVAVNRIAKWDGSSWAALDSGVDDEVHALTVFDDGSGAALYAGGDFRTAGGVEANGIAKWDGASWAALGSGMGQWGQVDALAVFDDGSGAALYAGGNFTTAGGVAADQIAKWDGSSWTPVGSGVGVGFHDWVHALTVFDDGGGEALYAGGYFTTASGVQANYIAKWDGSSWSALGDGVDRAVYALAVFDDGGGEALYAGGRFRTAGGLEANSIAKWDGSSWAPLGSGVNSSIFTLAAFDDGGGAALHAGGRLTTAGGVAANYIARWDGSSWSALGDGVSGTRGRRVNALTVFDDGSGAELYTGGEFVTAGGLGANNIARWDGSSWGVLGSGLDDSVSALTVFDDGSGAGLYAGGAFTTAGGVAVNHIAKWDGSSWSALGGGVSASVPSVDALAVFDDGSGAALYAGGTFTSAGGVAATHIARWNGSSWSALGGGMSNSVHALAVFDDGSGEALYAGGLFTLAGFGVATHIAKWDGSSWSGVGGGMDDEVLALAVFDDGGGEELYAGGTFTFAGGGLAPYIAKWDGSNWETFGGDLSGRVRALTVFDDGGGKALYAGGGFWFAGGVRVNSIAKWDGSGWAALGRGMFYGIHALAVFDDGGGDALYAGGKFATASDVAANRIAKWDGSSWAALGSGMDVGYSLCGVYALTVFDGGGGAALYAGGDFWRVTDSGDSLLARWGCKSLTAASTYRNARPNPASYSASPPIPGSTWTATVDLTTTGHSLAQILGYTSPATLTLSGGQVLLVGGTKIFVLPLRAGPIATWSDTTPTIPDLVGVHMYTQAVHIGGAPSFALSNAQDLVVGF